MPLILASTGGASMLREGIPFCFPTFIYQKLIKYDSITNN